MKRIVAGVLLVAMLLSFTACGGGSGTTGGGGGGGEQIVYEFIDNLPKDFDGAFVGEELIVAVDSNYEYELYAKEDSSETVDQLVYKRNQLLSQRFGCEIVSDPTQALNQLDMTSHYNFIRDTLLNASSEYDLIMLMAYQTGKLITSGYYLDWRADTTYCKASIEAGNEWWPTNINKDSTVYGHQYIAVSDLCLTTMEMCYSVLFNKDMESAENVAKKQFGTETLYQAVDQGKWTLQSFYEIVKDFYRDNEAAGVQGSVDEMDRFGLAAGGGTDSDAWAFALGFQYIINDGYNQPELWQVTNKTGNAIDTLRLLLHGDYTYGMTWGDQYDQRTQFFVDGRALFNLSTLEQLKRETFHEMDSDYGVLPYPKYDENQTKYYTGTMDHYTMLSIPLYNMKLQLTDVLVEALSAESANSVKEEYYESILKHNSTRDEDSARMIGIIMDGRRYDLTTYHYAEITSTGVDEGSLGLFFRRLLKSNLTVDAATHYQSVQPSYDEGMTALINSYTNMFG